MKFLLNVAAASSVAASSLVAAYAANTPPSPSLQEIVVTANRIGAAQRSDQLGTAVTVFNRSAIEDRQTRFLVDLLREAPGIAVNRGGAIGGVAQIRMRGAEGNHTLTLLDGVDLSDPFQGEFDFSTLSAEGIERIEVLRGEQSALYGSDAIGGVINVIPRRGAGRLAGGVLVEGGSFSTTRLGADVGAGNAAFDIFGSVSRFHSGGTNVSRFGTEADGARTLSGLVNAGWRVSENLELRGIVRLAESVFETDPQDFRFPARATQGLVIDADETGRIEQKTAALSATHTARGGAWTNKFSYAFTDAERESRGDGEVTFSTDGRRDRFSWASAAAFSIGAAENRVTAAFDWKRETYLNVALAAPGPENERRRLHNRGLVLAYDAVWRNFAFGAAYRYDDNSRFRDAETYRLQASLGLGESGARIRGAYGTGIKNPTNFELFGFNPTRFIGNPALKPESSRGWDIGLEQIFLNERARLAVTYFKARLADEIFTAFLPGFVSTPQNRTSISPRQGIELSLDARLAPPLSLNGSFSWIDAEEAGERELRRPRVTAALGLTYRFIDERVSATLAMRYTGTQDDSEFVSTTPQTRARLDDFLLVNLSASFDLTPRVTLFGRIENLLDQSYEEIFSYRSPGRSAYAGTRLRF